MKRNTNFWAAFFVVVALFGFETLSGHASNAVAEPFPTPSSSEHKSGSSSKIIGGSQASISDAPWQVALVRSNATNDFDGQFCGGSIYNSQWIITAAHCLSGRTASSIKVLAGTNFLSRSSVSGINVSSILMHPNYNSSTKANDIGLLRLSTPLTIRSGIVQPINLPVAPPAAGATALITGWGNMSRTSNLFPSYLQKAQVQIHTDTYCSSVYGAYSSSLMMCAYTPSYSVDTCQGDSGGPLAVNIGGRWELHGVTSFGIGCAQAPYPGVYAETFNYLNWIRNSADTTFTTTPTPTISGLLQSGQILTGNPGVWNPVPDNLSYQWMANNQAISGATSNTLTLIPELVGSRISLSVTGSKSGIATTTRTSSQTTAVLGSPQTVSGAQTLSGTPQVGQTLTANLSIWNQETTHTFVWFRGSAVISGANQSTYTLAPADLNQTIRVAVTGLRVGYNPLTLTSPATTPVTGAFILAPDPQITGTTAVGSTLTATTGTWSPTPRFTYQWLRDGANISGATSNKYTLTSADFERNISVSLIANLAGYPITSKTSSLAGPIQEGIFTQTVSPVVTGSLVNGGVLSASVSGWIPSPTSLQYQWFRSGIAIEGATQRTYQITSTDLGARISVRVTGSSTGVASATLESAVRQDWTYATTNYGTYTARSVYSNCISRASSSNVYNDWQNVGNTFWPCDPYLSNGVRLYDPRSDMMIIHAGFTGIPSGTLQYRLTFTYQTFQSHFGFLAADSGLDSLDSASRLIFPYAPSVRTVSSSWISLKEPGELDFLIYDSSSGSLSGFLSISTIQVELRSIR